MNHTLSNKILQLRFSTRVIGFSCAVLACIMFSLKPVLIKIAYSYGGNATSIMSLRAFCSLPIYLGMLFILLRNKVNRSAVRKYGILTCCIGILGYYVASLLDILSLKDISAQLERLLLFLYPTIVVFIVWGKSKQRPTNNTLLSALLGYLGVAVIFIHDFQMGGDRISVGAALVIASATAFAFYVVLSKSLIQKMGSSLFTSLAMTAAGGAIVIQLALSDVTASNWNAQLIVTGLVLGIFCTVIPSYLMSAALARLSSQEVSLTNNLAPL